MANNLKVNPIYLDVFSSDIEISLVPIYVKSIKFVGVGADDKLVLEDVDGVSVATIKLPTAKDSIMEYYDHRFNGLVCDVSDGTYTALSCVYIYL